MINVNGKLWLQLNVINDPSIRNENNIENISVAKKKDDCFTVVWSQKISDSEYRIFKREYSPEGEALGKREQVSPDGEMSMNGHVLLSPDGDIDVYYETYSSPTEGMNRIYYKSISGSDILLSDPEIETSLGGVLKDSSGDFILAVRTYGQEYEYSGETYVRYYSNGGKFIKEERVSPLTQKIMSVPAIAGTKDDFVVVWEDKENVYARKCINNKWSEIKKAFSHIKGKLKYKIKYNGQLSIVFEDHRKIFLWKEIEGIKEILLPPKEDGFWTMSETPWGDAELSFVFISWDEDVPRITDYHQLVIR
jgi:hypothetical protein